MSKQVITDENRTTENDPLFVDLNADEGATEISSLCMRCHETGMTKLLMTKIPYFGEIIIMAFLCDECGFRNSEIMPGGKVQDLGVEITMSNITEDDINRQVVKGQSATVKIPELDFEVPAGVGKLTSIEGFLEEAIFGLQHDQPIRRATQPEDAAKIDDFIEKLLELKHGKPFSLVLNDPTGNSFIENPDAPAKDPKVVITKYKRTPEQTATIGLQPETGENCESEEKYATNLTPNDIEDDEVVILPSVCSGCFADIEVKIKKLDIPYFKEVIIMAMHCDKCGERSNEVKSGGEISDHGTRMYLTCNSIEDLNRDILKSSFATVEIPEIKLEGAEGIGGDKFTTIEGIIDMMKSKFLSDNPFMRGDSVMPHIRQKMEDFKLDLEEICSGNKEFTFILDDPTSSSYIQSFYAPDPDPQLRIETYERTHEQNDNIGLLDMKTEGYEEEAKKEEPTGNSEVKTEENIE